VVPKEKPGGKKNKTKDLDELLLKFAEQKHPHLSDAVKTSINHEIATVDKKKNLELSYGALCRT
jgi:hypothetical protein